MLLISNSVKKTAENRPFQEKWLYICKMENDEISIFLLRFLARIGLSGQMVKQRKYRMKNKNPTKGREVEMAKKEGLTTKVAVLTTKVLQKHYKNTTESLQKHYFDSESTLQYLYKITISSLQCLYKTCYMKLRPRRGHTLNKLS